MSKITKQLPFDIACNLVLLRPEVLREAIVNGYEPCGPVRDAGGTEMFGENDMIALYYFARLLEEGVPAKLSGEWAMNVRAAVEFEPLLDRVVIARTPGGSMCHFFDVSADQAPGIGYGRYVDLAAIRARVRMIASEDVMELAA